jgi:hypothetical protein
LPFLVSRFAFCSFLLFIVFLLNRLRKGLIAAPPWHQSCRDWFGMPTEKQQVCENR